MVPRTIARLTVTLSLKEHSPRIKITTWYKSRHTQNKINIHLRHVRNNTGTSLLINSYHNTNENTHKFTTQSIVYLYVEDFFCLLKPSCNCAIERLLRLVTAPMAVVHLHLSWVDHELREFVVCALSKSEHCGRTLPWGSLCWLSVNNYTLI